MKQFRRRAWQVVKVLVSLSLLAWLILQVDLEQLVAIGSVTIWPLVGLALVLQFAGVWISAYKWWLALQTLDEQVSFLWIVQAYFIGQFFNNFLPTMIGGDAIRAYQLTQRTREPSTALTSLLIERMTGFLALTIIGAVALSVSFRQLTATTAVVWGLVACIGVAVTALLAAICAPLLVPYIVRVPLPNIGNWRGLFTRVAQALAKVYLDRRRLVIMLLLAFTYQFSWIGVNYLVIRALMLPISLTYTALVVPISDIVGLVPLFLNSLGSRSGTFIVLLEPLGITAASVVALSVLIYLSRMLVSCIGAVLYIVGSMTGSHRGLGRERTPVAEPTADPRHPG